jgi:hypothetical protein
VQFNELNRQEVTETIHFTYSWWKPTSSVKSWESRIWACKTFHWDSITST